MATVTPEQAGHDDGAERARLAMTAGWPLIAIGPLPADLAARKAYLTGAAAGLLSYLTGQAPDVGPGNSEPVQLEWHRIGTDEPLDQEADADVLPRAYWQCGPEHNGNWTVTLIQHDEVGSIVRELTWDGPSEAAVKEIAQAVEAGHIKLPRQVRT